MHTSNVNLFSVQYINMPSITKQRQLDLISARIELTGSGLLSAANARKALAAANVLARASGNKNAIKATRLASDLDAAVSGTGPKKKLAAVKKAFSRKNTQKAADVMKIAAAASGNPKAVAAAQTFDQIQKTIQGPPKGRGVYLAGRGKKTRLEKAMCA